MEKPSSIKNSDKPQSVVLNNRNNLILTGISEVISTNDKLLLLKLSNTKLTITGQNINIAKLVIDTGELEATGQFDSIVYSNQIKKNIFSRIFK
ncbi:MAG: hypothetical protein E7361_02970 [Clostridiales bacterium]|nr:hypothetical protein [Clostridiales bacterium]